MLPLLFELTSPAWQPGAIIPARYTCSGENLSPAIAWTAPPDKTASFALIFDDPDAPRRTWTHWTVWNIPASARGLPEALAATAGGVVQGTTDFGTVGYGGPCPPPGHGSHRYFLRLYALDQVLPLAAGAARTSLDTAIRDHMLARVELMGRFGR
jgi:Raf kinase inhibitor-like YbhB/YbcL family protein